MATQQPNLQELSQRFKELTRKDIHDQTEFFLKSFIFALGDNWKEVVKLSQQFAKYLADRGLTNEGDLDAAQAADFLQKNGKTRTAIQRRDEIRDVDLDKNDRISFIEYLLLHYKAMVLAEYYKRKELTPQEDLSNDAIGIVGVGAKLLEELFTMPLGLDPSLIKALEEFTAKKKEMEAKKKDLNEKASQGGVRGLAAKNELDQLEASDKTEMNRLEVTLEAAKKKSGEYALKKKKASEEAAAKKAKEDGRARLAERAAAFKK